MMHKNHQWADRPQALQWVPEEQETKNQKKKTGAVQAKDPLKVKLVNEKSPRTL